MADPADPDGRSTSRRLQSVVVHLLGGPHVTYGAERRVVPQGSKRLLAFVALRRDRVERAFAAGTLWPDGDDQRAARNLRSALWRLRRAGIDVVEADKWSMTLTADAAVDVHDIVGWADRLVLGAAEPEDLTIGNLPAQSCHLLPGWYDEWVVMERERVRQRVLHAMEALSVELAHRGRCAESVDVATRAVAEDPLRESAQRTLVAAHLAHDNLATARSAYLGFARLLRAELGVAPSRQLTELVAGLFVGASSRRGALPVARQA